MPKPSVTVCFCTLAIHAPYRQRARLLCADAPEVSWIVLTDEPEDFTDSAVLIGSPAQIVETLKTKVEAAGFDETILYFNLGLKPHARVKDEMARFMAEVAPAFTESPPANRST